MDRDACGCHPEVVGYRVPHTEVRREPNGALRTASVTYYPHQVPVRPEELRGQFLLTTREALVPTGWQVQGHGRWMLACTPPLRSIPIRTTSGALRGWLLGHAVDVDGQYLHHDASPALIVPATLDFGEVMDRLTGRFLGIDLSGASPRIHLDSQGTLAAVFAPAEECVASTSGLIPPSVETPFALQRILAADIPYAAVMYPLGLTPRDGVERVLPNHVLDTASWQLVRRWPPRGWTRDADPATLVRLVADTVRRALTAVQRVYGLELTLTAGRDSRMMLACTLELPSRPEAYTADLGDEIAWRDVHVAAQLAARAGIRHRVLRTGRAPRATRRAWVARTGGETGEPRGWKGCEAWDAQREGWATITGAAADLSRLVGWRLRFLSKPVAPEDVLSRCNAPRTAEFLARAESWLSRLPPLDPLAVADLVHLEQVQGCWAGVIEYGELGYSSARLCPMTSRAIVESTVRLPVEYRRQLLLHQDVIAAEWPALLEYPFNEQLAVPAKRRRVLALERWVKRRAAPLARAWRKSLADPAWLRSRLRRILP